MAEEKTLKGWLGELESVAEEGWSSIPEIGLYMDQVVSYLNRRLSFLETGEDPVLTPSMVNNYVKAGILARPNQKRYDKDQLAELYMLCSLKQALPMQEVAEVMADRKAHGTTEDIFRGFTEAQRAACLALGEQILPAKGDHEELMHLALSFALQASVARMAASHLIHFVRSEKAAEMKARQQADKEAAKSMRNAAKEARTKKNKEE